MANMNERLHLLIAILFVMYDLMTVGISTVELRVLTEGRIVATLYQHSDNCISLD
jgi:hypothetical protein